MFGGLIIPRMSRAEQRVTVETTVSEAILRSAGTGVWSCSQSEVNHHTSASYHVKVNDSYEDSGPAYSGWM
jgi:hypothetical protein